MASAISRYLRAQLSRIHAALRQMGLLDETRSHELAWWREPVKGLRCWWMLGRLARVPGENPRSVHFADAAEALALLTALVNLDYHACAMHVRDIWPENTHPRDDFIPSNSTTPLVFGFQYFIRNCDDYAPISERVLGVRSPSENFLKSYARLQSELLSLDADFPSEPIAVRLNIRCTGADALQSVLDEIVQNIIAQELAAQQSTTSEDAKLRVAASASMRFQIVEVCLEDTTTGTVEAVNYLAQLVKQGIRVPHLPTIRDNSVAAHGRVTLTRSLQTLLPPRDGNASKASINDVYVDDEMSQFLVPALFSVIQVNHTVERVDVQVKWDPEDDDSDGLKDPSRLWMWAAYALFSRHAQHKIWDLVLNVYWLDDYALEGIEQVLEAENPLNILFNTAFESDKWIAASRFSIEDPGDAAECDEVAVFEAPEPIRVRVVDKVRVGDAAWWRVLLPGCGAAWVLDSDATEIKSQLALGSGETRRLLHLKLEGVVPHSKAAVVALLQLLPHGPRSIEVARADDYDEEAFDMTYWVFDVLTSCPALERLSLPWNAKIERLHVFVQAAETGDVRLRCLALHHMFDPDTSDVIEFLDVLGYASNPLTRQLEELEFAVSVPDASARDFDAAWRRMLDNNRTLHKITLRLVARENIDEDREDVRIRTGPFCLASKVAFLSAVRNPVMCGAMGLLDTGVIADIFAFAEEFRMRKIYIDFKPRRNSVHLAREFHH
jgi:hypothetical protein